MSLPIVARPSTHHREFESLSFLSQTKPGKHYRSDPVRVQSTIPMTPQEQLVHDNLFRTYDFFRRLDVCWQTRERDSAADRNFAVNDTRGAS